jgi:hypothetical protein
VHRLFEAARIRKPNPVSPAGAELTREGPSADVFLSRDFPMTDREHNSWLHCAHCGRTGAATWRIEAGPRQRRRLETVTTVFTCVDAAALMPVFRCAACNKPAVMYDRPFRSGSACDQTATAFSRVLAMNTPTSLKA